MLKKIVSLSSRWRERFTVKAQVRELMQQRKVNASGAELYSAALHVPAFSLLIILQEGVHYGIVRADLWVRGTKKYLPGMGDEYDDPVGFR